MPYQAVLWMAGIGCEVAVIIHVQRYGRDSGYEVSHVVERVGLFLIIVLGESVVTSLNALDGHWSGAGAVVLGAGFVLFAALWWAYFDFGSAAAERVLASGENDRIRDVMGLGHFPIVAALTAMAAGVGTAVADPHHLPFGAAVAMCGGLACYRITFFVLAWRLRKQIGRSLAWLLPGLAVIGGTLALAYLHLVPAWAAVALLAAEACGQLVRSIKVARPRPVAGPDPAPEPVPPSGR